MLSVADGEALILFLAVLFTVVGATSVVGGRGTQRRERAFRAVAVQVPGMVTGLRFHRFGPAGDGPDGAWFPVLRFTTLDGRYVDTESMYGRSPPSARRGDQVTVVYDPADPTRATIDKPGRRRPRWGGGGVWFGARRDRPGARLRVHVPEVFIHDPADPDRVHPTLLFQMTRLNVAALVAAVQPRGVPVVAEHRM